MGSDNVTLYAQWTLVIPDSPYRSIESLISSSSGSYSGALVRNISDGASSNVTGINGEVIITSGSSITITIPEDYRSTDYVAEIQVNFENSPVSGASEAYFRLSDDSSNVLLDGTIEGDSDYESYQSSTFVFAFGSSTTLTIENTSSDEDLHLNGFIQFYALSADDADGVYIGDLRSGSSILNTGNTTATTNDWTDAVVADDQFYTDGIVEFDISSVISSMGDPVMEINFGREADDSCSVDVDTDDGASGTMTIGSWEGDYDSDELHGQRYVISLKDYKNKPFFQLDLEDTCYLNPFIKITDAEVTNTNNILLDTAIGSSLFVSKTSSAYYETSIPTSDNVEAFDGGLWEFDSSSGSSYQFNLPSEVASMDNPVLEIHFIVGDSDSDMSYTISDQDVNQIATVYYESFEDDMSAVLVNQVPLGSFKSATSLIISSSDDHDAYVGRYIRVFDAKID